MTQTLRTYWRPRQGRHVLDIPWDRIQSRAVVVVTVAEWARGEGVIVEGDQPRWVGDANIWIAGIAPRDGGVRVAVNIDWHEPLPFVTDVTILAEGADSIVYE